MSGNKWLLLLVIAFLAGACSPKIRPVSKPVPDTATKTTQKPEKENKDKDKEKAKPENKVSDRFSTIALILPFGLDHLNPGAIYTAAGLKKASLALDYYRGFKLALDSLTEQGANYKLQVFDSKDEPATSHSLALNPQIRSSDLIVGPVFPDGIKSFITVPNPANKLVLSPLSPASPLTFKNPNLVTIIPPLEYHALRAAEFVTSKNKTKKVFILTSGYSDERDYIRYFKKGLDSLSKKKIKIIPLTVVRGDLKPILAQLTKFDQNFFLIPSTKQAFIQVTLHSLDTLSRRFPVTVVGHPNWEKYAYLKADLLQKLNTHITSADRVNYKAATTITFVRAYRKTYHSEPSDYAIKAFDEGLYFGQLLADGTDNLKKLDDNEFTGLHNSFSFIKKNGQGWVNTHVNILKYTNFELKQVE
ncbi:hypothetical protein GCM10023149_43130 [Mucilaginibacter gynuensis]|uniref:ABC-type branched-subunit amino acid transport system substrate-binding protein n=1 Tax=Mucilaginibacter gynuensis TaxID=1302236 RepID=A0ABP8H7E5_9SPHI